MTNSSFLRASVLATAVHAVHRMVSTEALAMQLLRRVWRRSGMKHCWTAIRFAALRREWMHARSRSLAAKDTEHDVITILLIPPDPVLLVASRGDQAMLLSLIQLCQANFDEPRLLVATADASAHQDAAAMGLQPCRVLDTGMPLAESVRLLLDERITHCITVGADVLDGSYDPVFSGRLLMLTDLLARAGVRSMVNGFSFSTKPHPGLAVIFERASAQVSYNLRDPVSLQRFTAFCSAPAALSADVAFLLKTGEAMAKAVGPIASWIGQQRAQGRTVLGANIHPLLLDLEQRQHLPRLVNAFADAAAQVVQQCNVSIVLLEHDYRGASSDKLCLNPLETALRAAGCGKHLYRSPARLSAEELKQTAAALDGVATGRMHLAIATLGSGVPVLAFGYKDKMEGLLKHFELPRRLLLAGEELTDPVAYLDALKYLAVNHDQLSAQVRAKLPTVTQLARRNLLPFAEPHPCEAVHATPVD